MPIISSPGTEPFYVIQSSPWTVGTNFEYVEDSIHISGSIGAFVLAVRNDAGTPLASDGEYIPFTTDATGALRVTGSAPTINFEYPEDSPHVSGDIGAFVLAVRNDAGTPLGADGDYVPFTTDAFGALRVAASVAINYAYAEDSPHVSGDIGAFVLAVRNDTAATLTTTDGDYSAFATDAAGRVGITDLGGSVTVDGTFWQATQPVSGTFWQATQPVSGTFWQATQPVSGPLTDVQLRATPVPVSGPVTDTQLRAAPVPVSGPLTDVQLRATPIPISGTVTITDGAGPITIDGTVTVNQGTSPWVTDDLTFATDTVDASGSAVSITGTVTTDDLTFADDKVDTSGSVVALDAPTLAALESITIQNGAAGAAVNIQDGGNSITVDNAALSVAGGGVEVAALRVTIANDSTGLLSVDDNGGSLTVDGTFWQATQPVSGTFWQATQPVSGTFWQATQPVSGPLTDVQLRATPVPVSGPLTDTQLRATPVPISGTVTITDGSGPITVDGTVELGATTLTALESITVQNGAGASAVNIQDGGNSITVDGTFWQATQPVSGTFWQATQPVSGPLTDTQLRATPVPISGTVTITDGSGPVTVDGTVELGATTLTALESITVQNGAGASAVNIQDGGNSITVDGTFWQATQPVSGPLTDVQLRATPVPISGTVTITDGSGPITVDGTVELGATTLAALESITVQNGAGASAVNIQDGGNSITVDNAALSIVGGGVEVAALRVTIANDSTGLVSVDDNGGSLTVDGTFWQATQPVSGTFWQATQPVSGTFWQATQPVSGPLTDTQLRATPVPVSGTVTITDGSGPVTVDGTVELGATTLAALETITVLQGTSPWIVSGALSITGTYTPSDVQVNPTDAMPVEGFNMVWNSGGSVWERVRIGTATGSVLVNNPTAANLLVTATIDAGSLAALESITVQNGAGASAVNIQDGGNSITVDGIFWQATQPVSGTFWQATQPVSGPLTDVQLRATSVPVSGPLTDTQLRATPVPISGTVTITDGSGPITVDGTVELGATTLAALESITVQNGAGASAVNIQDGGNSITVDNAVISVIGGGTEAAAQRVTIATDSTGVLSVDDNGGSLTVDGTFWQATQPVSGTFWQATQPVSGTFWQATQPVSGPLTDAQLRATPVPISGTVTITDGSGPVTVDGTVELGATTLAALESITVQNGAGASAVNIQDGGNSITIDNAALSVVGGGVEVAALRVTIANDSTGVLSVDDNGGSLTVDGTFWQATQPVSGTFWQATQPVSGTFWQATQPVSGTVALDAPTLAALESITVQNASGASAVNIQDGGNSITIDNAIISVIGGGTEAAAQRVTIANDSTGVLSVDDNGGSLTVDGSVAITNAAGASAVNIQDGGNSITVDGTVAVSGTVTTAETWAVGTLANGAETAVSSSAVSVLALNAARKKLIIQNTGVNNVRIGIAAVAATTGFRLSPGGSMVFEMPHCPTGQIFAIREGAADSVVFAQEVT